jgi:putative flippase GtrA
LQTLRTIFFPNSSALGTVAGLDVAVGQALRFTVVGLVNVLPSFGVYLIAPQFVSYVPAYVCAIAAALIYTTALNIRYVFSCKIKAGVAAAFAAYYLVYFTANLVLLDLVVKFLSPQAEIAPLLVLPSPITVHFLISRALIIGLGSPSKRP